MNFFERIASDIDLQLDSTISKKFISKCNEFMRLSLLSYKDMGSKERWRSHAIFQLACDVLNIFYDHSKFNRLIPSQKDYRSCKEMLSTVLRIEKDKVYTLPPLLLSLHLPTSLDHDVKEILDLFNQNYVSKLDARVRISYDLRSKAYLVAGLSVVATRKKIKLPQKMLASKAAIDFNQYKSICDLIDENTANQDMNDEHNIDKEHEEDSLQITIKPFKESLSSSSFAHNGPLDESKGMESLRFPMAFKDRTNIISDVGKSSHYNSILGRSSSSSRMIPQTHRSSTITSESTLLPRRSSYSTIIQESSVSEEQLESQRKEKWEREEYELWKQSLENNYDSYVISLPKKRRLE